MTFNGLDQALLGGGDFVKALDIDHALDGEVMLAYQMNGADIPMLNGYPVKLIVPGYYGTYWVKHLSEIEVVDHVFDGFWMKPAYRIPDNDCACVEPGTSAPRHAADRPLQRALVHHLGQGRRAACVRASRSAVRGIAFDGGQGIREVAYSTDGGSTWREAALGADLGPLFVPRVHLRLHAGALAARPACARLEPLGAEPAAWRRCGNPAGYMRNVVESGRASTRYEER